MSDYERNTVFPVSQVFAIAEEVFPARADLVRTGADREHVVYSGDEGTVEVEAHRHGPYTVVTARTDRLRTSKLDIVTRFFLNQLPYQLGDPPRE
jgi:hypothetical protein